jgi:3-dehydroquinate dehydratase-2
MKVLIINGPNLNLLGTREPGVYGNQTFKDYLSALKEKYNNVQFDYYQSNVEGDLVGELHRADNKYNAVILNAGAYTHTSLAIADAVAAISVPVVEVHISNIFSREDYRHVSYLGKHCKGSVSGFGIKGYEIALQSFLLKD